MAPEKQLERTIKGILDNAREMNALPIEDALKGYRDAETFGWVLNPTAYQRSASSRERGEKIVLSASRFLAEIRAALSEVDQLVFDAVKPEATK